MSNGVVCNRVSRRCGTLAFGSPAPKSWYGRQVHNADNISHCDSRRLGCMNQVANSLLGAPLNTPDHPFLGSTSLLATSVVPTTPRAHSAAQLAPATGGVHHRHPRAHPRGRQGDPDGGDQLPLHPQEAALQAPRARAYQGASPSLFTQHLTSRTSPS
eukprot:1187214-Prorocentrum_minimum.AAC.1